MSVPFFLVDAFASAPFGGNSAAVCLLDGPADAAWMQAVAAEAQQPATAFVWPGEDGGFGLRWFVAASELTLCGHGTLASAHVLWETERLASHVPARFETVGGALSARRDGDLIVLDFPAEPVQPIRPEDAPPHLVEALGVEPRAIARGRLDYLVELASEEAVRAVRPDFGRLRLVETRGVIVTALAAPESDDSSLAAAAGAPGYDVVSRFFAPSVGLNEDAVTGSAHCAIGPYWGERLGRTTLVAYQASARGGRLAVRLVGDRVELGGPAVTVLSGSLLAPLPSPA
jgi:PhzF family phenazine biosynthesis protein